MKDAKDDLIRHWQTWAKGDTIHVECRDGRRRLDDLSVAELTTLVTPTEGPCLTRSKTRRERHVYPVQDVFRHLPSDDEMATGGGGGLASSMTVWPHDPECPMGPRDVQHIRKQMNEWVRLTTTTTTTTDMDDVGGGGKVVMDDPLLANEPLAHYTGVAPAFFGPGRARYHRILIPTTMDEYVRGEKITSDGELRLYFIPDTDRRPTQAVLANASTSIPRLQAGTIVEIEPRGGGGRPAVLSLPWLLRVLREDYHRIADTPDPSVSAPPPRPPLRRTLADRCLKYYDPRVPIRDQRDMFPLQCTVHTGQLLTDGVRSYHFTAPFQTTLYWGEDAFTHEPFISFKDQYGRLARMTHYVSSPFPMYSNAVDGNLFLQISDCDRVRIPVEYDSPRRRGRQQRRRDDDDDILGRNDDHDDDEDDLAIDRDDRPVALWKQRKTKSGGVEPRPFRALHLDAALKTAKMNWTERPWGENVVNDDDGGDDKRGVVAEVDLSNHPDIRARRIGGSLRIYMNPDRPDEIQDVRIVRVPVETHVVLFKDGFQRNARYTSRYLFTGDENHQDEGVNNDEHFRTLMGKGATYPQALRQLSFDGNKLGGWPHWLTDTSPWKDKDGREVLLCQLSNNVYIKKQTINNKMPAWTPTDPDVATRSTVYVWLNGGDQLRWTIQSAP